MFTPHVHSNLLNADPKACLCSVISGSPCYLRRLWSGQFIYPVLFFVCVCVKVSTLCLCVIVVKKDFNKWIWEQTRADRHRQIGSWSVRDESSRHSKVAVLNELEAVVSPKGDR